MKTLKMDTILPNIQTLVASNSGIFLPIFRTTATLGGLVLVVTGLTGLVSPIRLGIQFGIPLKAGPSSSSQDSKRNAKNDAAGNDQVVTEAWITACAGRELVLGAVILSLNYLEEYRALGVTMMLGNVVGVVDTIAVLKGGVEGASKMHFIPTALLVWVGPLGILLDGIVRK